MAFHPLSQDDCQWYLRTDGGQEQECDESLHTIFNELSICESTSYQYGQWNLSANLYAKQTTLTSGSPSKSQSILFPQIVQHTSSNMESDSKTNVNNNGNNNHDNTDISCKNLNNYNLNVNQSPLLWAFVNENNALIKVDNNYQQFLNNLCLNMAKNYQSKSRFTYRVLKRSLNLAQQTNIQTQSVRHLYRVLTTLNNKTIDSMVGVEMAKELFFRTVDKSKYKIIKIEEIKHCDQELYYFTHYQKYKENYSGESFEKLLFHGTDTSILKQIEKNGFDRNFNKTALYGKVKLSCFVLFCLVLFCCFA